MHAIEWRWDCLHWLVGGAVWLLLANAGQAAEPVQAFVEGLRDRGYYDTALAYIDEMERQGKLPLELKELLPYERAQTLLASARDLNNVDDQRQQLDAAQAAFQQFAKNSPTHPLAAMANTWRGRILFEKARVEIFEADDPSHESNRKDYQKKARTLLIEARRVFEDAAALHKKAFDQFPTFIPEEDKPQHAARSKVENSYIEVVFDMSKCSYWEARTFDKGSKEAAGALQKAQVEFTDMHDRTRNNTGGKFARLWQGKCFEELDQITQALGVYEDLLALTPDTPVKAALYDLALRFKLICLNHEQKKDYPLVVTLAQEWLADAKGRTRTEVGNGIQWELCRALEQIGKDTTKPESERTHALNEALTRVRSLGRTAGEFKAPSNAMIQRLLLTLNRNADVPTDFGTAYGMAAKHSEDINLLRQQVATAQQEGNLAEAKAKQAALKASAAEMSKLCDIALKMSKPSTDPSELYRANVLLAYGYLLDDRLLEAAAVGEFTMRSLLQQSPESAKNAGLIAMLAFDRAYQKAEKGNREFEYRKLVEFATRLDQKFPESEQANDARLTIARVMWDERRLDEAALWWNKVPAGATHYGGAQLSTGQAYWGQYTTQLNLPEEKRPGKEKLAEWRDLAIKHLEVGIAERMRSTPADSASPDDLIRGKVTLAQIRNLSGVYHTVDKSVGSIELLTEEPHSVVQAIAVPRGTERPKTPGSPKSRAMASFAYQQLLKAQIGAKDLDAAREARFKLEEVAGSDDAEALTQVFVEFGQELEKELKQLKAAGETGRADEVLAGFESFLNDLFERQEGQNFTSLFWIAETFTSLADSSSENQERAKEFYTKAGGAYQEIVDKAKADSKFAQPDQLMYSKMRLVNCKQSQGDFTGGDALLKEVMKEKKAVDSPNMQFAAASLYQAWAGSSEPEAAKKYQTAIQGMKSPVVVWGWAYTAQRLQRVQMTKPDPRIAALEYDARYNLGLCQLAFAKQHGTPAERTKGLTQAKSGVETFARLTKSFPPEQFDRFNSLYREIQQESGAIPVDLPVGAGAVANAKNPNEATVGSKSETEPPPEDPLVTPVAETKVLPQAQTNYGMIALMGLVGVGAIVAILYASRKPSKRNASRRSPETRVSPPASDAEIDLASPGGPATPSAPASTSPASPSPTAKPKPTRLPGKPKSGST